MIEAAMYMALGFCAAGLIGLAILPAFYRRASRLTEEALRAVNPSSYAEVRAAQDQARALHAIELRRVERQLENERAKAFKHHLAASNLKSEIATQTKVYRQQINDLQSEIAARKDDRQAMDLLSEELQSVKKKLGEAEAALAESWAKDLESDTSKTPKPDAAEGIEWLPASDTMALATITGLEAEVAMLKAKLLKYEPSAAQEIEAFRAEPASNKLAELEGQLVDTELKYIDAQAEVARLSLMLDSANVADSEIEDRQTAQNKGLTIENARLQSELEGKSRLLDRLTGQVERLRNDVSASPAVAELRKDFRELVSRISSADAVNVTDAPVGEAQDPRPPEPSDIQPEPAIDDTRQTALASPSDGFGSDGENLDNGQDQTTARPAEIASAAEALVSRIVASNRKNSRRKTVEVKASPTQAPAAAPATQSASPPAEPKSPKQKKRDVA